MKIVLEHIETNQGIYLIRCLNNNKVYIGRSVDVRCRILTHLNELKRNIHSNSYMQYSFNKYGEDSFKFKVLEVVDNKGELNKREAYWGSYYKAIENGFNICPFVRSKNVGDKHGELVIGEKNGKSKLSKEKVIDICNLVNKGLSGVKIGEEYGVTANTALNIKNGRTWGHLSKKYLKEEIIEKWNEERKEKWCA